MAIIQELNKVLPDEYAPEPRVLLGTIPEIDFSVNAGNEELQPTVARGSGTDDTVDEELTEQYAYEVLVYDQTRARQLVAAVEIVSPANKDRPENRQAFVTKCAALLQQRVCVSIVDLVTTRNFNLYCELLELIGQTDPRFSPKAPATYAVTCRGRKVRHAGGTRPRFETWAYPLVVGEPLPTLPIWLAEDLAVSLNLEASYEEACRALRIR
jgi:hypothetical protein